MTAPFIDGIAPYGTLDRLLHFLALGPRVVRELSLDLELSSVRVGDRSVADDALFVLGLARSGTTALLRTLYESACFRSLTYRDMPFVLMPHTWARILRSHRSTIPLTERAHGDQVFIDADSPEAFEEVFWLTALEGRYENATSLVAHKPSLEIVNRFRKYVSVVLASDYTGALPERRRYLSKNNNNLLRLDSLSTYMAAATFLVVFRSPFDTALSSLSQHQRFSTIQARDRFSLRYMNWLGHREFGLGHKPFVFSEREASAVDSPNTPDYWLAYWVAVHEHLLSLSRANVLFVSYEQFCVDPESAIARIRSRVPISLPRKYLTGIRKPSTGYTATFSQKLANRAREIFDALTGRVKEA